MAKGENTIIYVMGVSGSGKSTIGQALADHLAIPFADGDDFHPPENVAKMAAGKPLEDTDRTGWLAAIHAYAKKQSQQRGAVIACSALKQKYRRQLDAGLVSGKVVWVYLKGDFHLIRQRMQARQGHFMPESLLQSQFDTLEEPSGALIVSIAQSPQDVVAEIIDRLAEQK